MSKYDYLIHNAMEAEAHTLITDEEALLLPGDACHESPQTKHQVHPYAFDDFITSLPSNLNFKDIDPQRVLHAATVRL